MSADAYDWTLRMTLLVHFKGKRQEEVFDLFSSWWREQGRAHDITATEITTLSKKPIPPTVEIFEEDLL